ncbi:hypothetical protein [Flammeovirga agarivorans]|uniref:hypothetical protein n=1 Tax=Flammeovirga agarivorans TaxID=2726742 RepID=UPI001B3B1EDB|nr:hypothetical protein [Flammeovirga agarivorans]
MAHFNQELEVFSTKKEAEKWVNAHKKLTDRNLRSLTRSGVDELPLPLKKQGILDAIRSVTNQLKQCQPNLSTSNFVSLSESETMLKKRAEVRKLNIEQNFSKKRE